MAQIQITMTTDNAAMQDDATGEPDAYAIADILRTLAGEIEANGLGTLPRKLRDANGNPVGEASASE